MARWIPLLLAGLAPWAARAEPLVGRVLDGAGQPVGQAAVWLLTQGDDGGWSGQSTRSADDGGFTFAATGRAALLARVPGRGSAAALAVTGRAELRLAPGDTLEGQVLDAQRRPLAGARVTLNGLFGDGRTVSLPDAAAERLWPAVSGADGLWRLTEVPTELLRRVAVRAERAAWSESWIGAGYQWSPARLTILADGAALDGRVLGADGRPAANLRLRAADEETRTAADGSFEFAHVPRDGTVDVFVPGPTSDRTGLRLWRGNAGTAGRLALRQPQRGRVRGRVMGRDGQPESARTVGLQGPDRWNLSTETGADGGYEFVTWPGGYTVVVYGSGAPPPATVTVTAGATATVPTLTVPRARRRVVVSDTQGRALAGTTLWVSVGYVTASRQTTDARGGLVVDTAFAAGQAKLRVCGTDPWAIAEAALGADARPLAVILKPLEPLVPDTTDRVVDDQGEPVAGACVVFDVLPNDKGVPMHLPRCLEVITDERGAWHLPPLPRGQALMASVESPGIRASRGLMQQVAGRTSTIQMTSLRSRATGRVVDSAGQPVAGALVFADGYLGARPAVSAADGQFTCAGLPRARLTVTALRGRRAVARIECQIPADGLTLRLAELPPRTWSAEPSDADVDLAHAIITAALPQAADPALGAGLPMQMADWANSDAARWLALLARIEPGEALDQMARRPHWARTPLLPAMLDATPDEVRFDASLLRFVRQVEGTAERRQAARRASDHLPSARRDLHEELLAIALGASETNRRPAVALEQAEALATLTLRAGRPGTEVLRAFATAYAQCPTDAGGGPSWLTEVGLPPALLDAVTPLVKDPAALTQARCASLLRALVFHREAAWATARGWWPGTDGQPRWPSPQSARLPRRLRLAAARGIVDEQPEQAVRLLDGLTFAEVLNCAATASNASAARRLLAVAVERQAQDQQSTRARLALAAPLDAGLAERCRQDALATWRTSPSQLDALGGRAAALSDGSVNMAYGLGLVDPNRARWVIESALTAAPPYPGNGADLVLAMAAFDPERARRMAAAGGPTTVELRALAEWLLADRGERVSDSRAGRPEW